MKGTENAAERILSSFYRHPILPALSFFPMIDLSTILDPYRVFGCKPMHVLSYDVSWMFKECLREMLKDVTRPINAMLKRYSSEPTFISTEKTLLKASNGFLTLVEKIFLRYGLNVYLRNCDRTDCLDGFY